MIPGVGSNHFAIGTTLFKEGTREEDQVHSTIIFFFAKCFIHSAQLTCRSEILLTFKTEHTGGHLCKAAFNDVVQTSTAVI